MSAVARPPVVRVSSQQHRSARSVRGVPLDMINIAGQVHAKFIPKESRRNDFEVLREFTSRRIRPRFARGRACRNDGDLELLDPELHSPEMLKCVWEDAITDIVVVRTGKGETCPEGYELIDRTPMNHNADLNHGSITSWGLHRAVHLAVRRQHVSKRNDYIAEIQVVYGDSDELPAGQGWELVETSVSGKSANLNQGGDGTLLAVRRAVRNVVDCPAAVCSVCVLLLNKEEHPPPGYRVIRKNLNRGKFGDVVQLGYQVGGALSTCRLPFRSMILDRYPEQDSAMFPFPGEQLPMFVYPKGMFLEQRSGRDTPKSSFFSFVFTNVDGRRTYTACLTFYEPMLPSTARRLTRKLFTCPPDSRPISVGVGQEQATQGRTRIPGSVSVGGLSTLLQQSGPRSRSGTGSWSALGRGDRAGWPPPLVRGGLGSSTPPIPPASWAKLSASMQAARYATTHGQSPIQPSESDGFSSTAATDPLHRQDSHPPSLRAAYAHVSEGANSAFPSDGWRNGDLGGRESPRRERGSSAESEHRRVGVEADIIQPIRPTPAAETEHAGGEITPAHSETRPSDASVHELGAPGGNVRADLSDHEYDIMCRREDRPCIFAPKTICVISRFPIYGVLRRFLRHLYAISLSWSGVPLERYISMFVSCIPMPPPGGCPYHVYLEHLENQDPRRSRLKPLSLQMPPDAWLPLMDIDFTAPFRCLSVQSVLTVFALMLQIHGFCSLPGFQEAKILFLSSRAELLTQVMEALRSLLFPMEWQSVYVPQLPYAMVEYLECPGGFMIGMRLSKGELEQGTGGTATIVRDLGLDGVANAVNLDAGEVLLYSGHLADTMTTKAGRNPKAANKRYDGLSHRRPYNRDSTPPKRRCSKSLRQALGICPVKRRQAEKDGAHQQTSNTFVPKDEETATPWLPGRLHDGLAARLGRELFGKAGVRTGAEEDLDQYESAFEFAPAPDRTDSFPGDGYGFKHRVHFSSEHTQSTDGRGSAGIPASTSHHGDRGTDDSSTELDTTLIVRDSFLCCMAELLGGICGYLRKSEARRSRHSLRTKPPDELFNMTEFLQGTDQGARPFLQRLTSTQMFWGMVQQWLGSSPADSHLFFFEECAVTMKNRLAGAVVPFRDTDIPGCEGDGWTHDNFIPLVEEVRLKRPDLYGLNSHDLCGSSQFEGSRSTSLPTPLTGSRGKAWDLNARPVQAVVRPTSGDATPGQSASGGAGFCRICTGRPVIIPGPTVQGLADQERKASFRYDNGWPTPLNRSLLHTVPDALPPVVLKLQLQARLQSRRLSQSDKNVTSPGTSHAGKPFVVNMNASDHAADPVREEPMSSSRLPPQEGNRQQPGYRGDKRFWRPHGHGKMVYEDGMVYEGEWRQGLHHGQGSMYICDGNRYTGHWNLGKKTGSGIMTYPDGARYQGGWLDDHRHGQGTYSYASGAVYKGGWEGGRMHGTGCYTEGCASRFSQDDGHERMAYLGGRTLVEKCGDGVPYGCGTDTLSNGTIFEGSFKRDHNHGVGTIKSDDGGVVNQLWENGKLVTTSQENPCDLVQHQPRK